MLIDWINKILVANQIGFIAALFIGILLVIFIQNLVFYLNYKDRSYLWYALYIFVILSDQLFINFDIYHNLKFGTELRLGNSIHHTLEWLYNSAYFIFVINFGGQALFNKNKARILKQIVGAMLMLLIVLLVIDLFTKANWVGNGFLYVAVPVLSGLSIVVFRYLFSMDSPIRNYILWGAFSFTVFSIIALVTTMISNKYIALGWGIFYIGVFIENIFFSIGLVIKQKLVFKERDASQRELIKQLRENQKLKNKLADHLKEKVAEKTKEVVLLHKKAEEDRIKKIEIAFEKEMSELKISSLQSQMNPHFIFNSLNSIKLYIIKNDKENAVYYLNKFSKLVRKILSASREKEVSLQEELETVELYVNIENIRFKNSIQFKIEIDEGLNLSTIKIPPLLLQPFIENAIWHGLSSKRGAKELTVKVTKESSKFIKIHIIDNGIGRKKAMLLKDNKLHKKESIGIKLTSERLAIFSKNFENKHHLKFIDIEEDKGFGTKVIIDLPIQ